MHFTTQKVANILIVVKISLMATPSKNNLFTCLIGVVPTYHRHRLRLARDVGARRSPFHVFVESKKEKEDDTELVERFRIEANIVGD